MIWRLDMKKTVAVITAVILCLSSFPFPVSAEEGAEGKAPSGSVSVSGEESGSADAAVSPSFRKKLFSELSSSGKLEYSPELSKAVITEDVENGGIRIECAPDALGSGRIIISEEYDFDAAPDGREAPAGPVGRISADGLSAKKASVTMNVYLDDEEEPCASILLRKQMGKTGWARDGELTCGVLEKNIRGKHRVSIGFSVSASSKKTEILLRSLTFCENSVPVMYFDLDESEGSIDSMNSSDDHSAECYGSATLEVPSGYKGEFSDSVLMTRENMELEYIRGRGNSTWEQDKKPYKVKFDKKQDLLGMGENKHWVLLADRYDNSLLRNRVTYWIVRRLGIEYAIKCAPVEVVMNGRYFGCYLLSEQVRVGANRVDIPELDEKVSDPDSPLITGGYLINLSGYDEDPTAFITKRGGAYSIESPDITDYPKGEDAAAAIAAQKNYITEYFDRTEDALFGDGLRNADGEPYTAFLDEDSAVNYWWIQEFSMNGDAFGGGSNYMYKKRDTVNGEGGTERGLLYWGPLWDFDYVAWGNPNCDPDKYDEFSNTSNDWMRRLRGDAEFAGRLMARWSDAYDKDGLYDAHLSDAVSEVVKEGGVIDRYYKDVMVPEYYDNAKYGFYNENSYYGGYGYSAQQAQDAEEEQKEEEQKEEQTYRSEVEQLRSWISLRKSWVDENISQVGLPSYTVRFLIDGETVDTRTRADGEQIGQMPGAPERKGYTFLGWYDSDDLAVDEDLYVFSDMDLAAKYVKTSSLKKAKDIFFSTYDAYDYYYADLDDDNCYYPTYTLMPEDSAPENIVWSVDDPDTAEVKENGAVAPKKTGTVTVTATLSSGRKKSFRVTFLDSSSEMFDLETITLNRSGLSLKTGAYTQLVADIDPKPHYLSTVDWFSTDPAVASVDEFGIVKARKPGSASVVAFDPESRQLAVCRVTVAASASYKIKAAKKAKVKSVKAKAVRSGKKRGVRVSWKKAAGVSGYYVLRSARKNGKYKKAGVVKKAGSVKWTDKKVKAGKKYYYKVRPFTKIGGKTYKGRLSSAASARVR